MKLADLFGPDAILAPHEDTEEHLRRGNIALLIVFAPTITASWRHKLYLGAIRKVPAVGAEAERWDIMPLADVTDRGEDGAIKRAAALARCAGRDRFEAVETTPDLVPTKMLTVLVSVVEKS